MIDKLKNWLIIILMMFTLYLVVTNAATNALVKKQSEQISKQELQITNLQQRINADVEASKQKTDLKKEVNNNEDSAVINHVFSASVLNRLRAY